MKKTVIDLYIKEYNGFVTRPKYHNVLILFIVFTEIYVL